ncbi:MAG: hypothetical protein LZT29_00937 [Pantoea stewartii]|nr:hypothetical protein C7433_1067 [Pantoea sp. PNA 03-3]WHS98045.1 MAG: hypothetical protein LZT29_00937 [Pantoea stewartii]
MTPISPNSMPRVCLQLVKVKMENTVIDFYRRDGRKMELASQKIMISGVSLVTS